MDNIADRMVGNYKGTLRYHGSDVERKFSFNLEIFRYNPKTKLFLAEGDDEFGDSSIIGAVDLYYDIIKFDKYYINKDCPLVLNNLKSGLFYEPVFRNILFTGNFVGERLHFGGDYFYPGVKEPAGSWEMVKVEK